MSISLDPEGNEIRTLFGLFNAFTGKSVLEIGCGDGRLTRRYAEHAARVTAIDPDAGRIQKALAERSEQLAQVSFLNMGLETLAAQNHDKFDIAILAWSL